MDNLSSKIEAIVQVVNSLSNDVENLNSVLKENRQRSIAVMGNQKKLFDRIVLVEKNLSQKREGVHEEPIRDEIKSLHSDMFKKIESLSSHLKETEQRLSNQKVNRIFWLPWIVLSIGFACVLYNLQVISKKLGSPEYQESISTLMNIHDNEINQYKTLLAGSISKEITAEEKAKVLFLDNITKNHGSFDMFNKVYFLRSQIIKEIEREADYLSKRGFLTEKEKKVKMDSYYNR